MFGCDKLIVGEDVPAHRDMWHKTIPPREAFPATAMWTEYFIAFQTILFTQHSIIKVLTSLSSSQLMRPFKSEHWMQTPLYKLKKGEHSKFSDSNILSNCLSLTRFARSVSSLVTILLVFIRRARRFFQFPFSPLSHHSLILSDFESDSGKFSPRC